MRSAQSLHVELIVVASLHLEMVAGGAHQVGQAFEAMIAYIEARPVAGDLAEELFVLMSLGDDRAVRATYVAGAMASE